MAIIVQKFGGSSLTDLDRLQRVVDRVVSTARDGNQLVVVVSAMGNTTNELLSLARQVSQRPDRRELDMLLSVGERISMALVAMAVRERGLGCVSLTGSQSGIITDENHSGARVVEVRPDRVRRHLDQGEVVIVAGFQGVSRSREVTTLGRGGSDTTAVVLAAALGAERCEIFSDVDGVYSADPRAVPDAVRLEGISLDEALTMARGGARVLYEDAVRFAREQGVTLVARSTFGPGAGTRLHAVREPVGRSVGVTSDAQLARVVLDPSHRLETLHALVGAGGVVRRQQGEVVWVDLRNAHAGLPALPGTGVDEGVTCIIAAVGTSVGEDAVSVAVATEALQQAGVEVRARGAGGDEAWWELASPGQEQLALRAVHGVLRPT